MLALITNEVTDQVGSAGLGLITNEVTGEVGFAGALGLITNEVTDTLGRWGEPPPPGQSSYWKWGVALTSVAGALLLAFHGYRRTGETPAAIGWGILGAIFPVNLVAGGVAAAQGFGKRKGASK